MKARPFVQRRQRSMTAWKCAVRGLTWMYADTWVRTRGMTHAKFKVRIHLQALGARSVPLDTTDGAARGSLASMNRTSKIALLLVLLAAMILGWMAKSKEGCFRDDPIDDPRPACKPGDTECKVDAPADPKPPPIGGPS